MQKSLLFCLLGVCIINAHAASTVELNVSATLTSSACTPSISGDDVDFGNILLARMSSTAVNQLGARETSLTITCDDATSVAFTATDDRADSMQPEQVSGQVANAAFMFGLGKTLGGVKIGAYLLTLADGKITADGVEKNLLYTLNLTTPSWGVAGGGSYLYPTGTIAYTVGSADKVPVAFKSAKFPLRIYASVQDTTTLAISDETKLDGLATFSLIYL